MTFKPYVLKSTNKGTKHGRAIANGHYLKMELFTRLEQDFENAKSYLFAGTEFGIFFSIDEGANWTQLKAGIPTIAVKRFSYSGA